MPGATPYAWQSHAVTWLALAVFVAAVVVGHQRLSRAGQHPIPWSRRQMTLFTGACLSAAVALTWPVADVAAHWSLIALVIQRLILVLAVAPLLLLGLPYDLIQWATRPAPVDAVLTRLARPPVAVVTVTVLLVGSMTPLLVQAQADHWWARGLLDLAMVFAGLVLWIPVLGRIPGILRPKPVVRFGYLVIQAVVPAFLSFIYIFSTRPLYSAFAGSHLADGLRPLNDQQISGFVSKLTMLLVLLTVGGVVLARAPTSEDDFGPDDPLVWADVERQFERADRKGQRVAEPSDSADLGPEPPPVRDLSEHPANGNDPPEIDPSDPPESG